MAKRGRPKAPLSPDRIREILRDARDRAWPRLPDLVEKLAEQGSGGDIRAAVTIIQNILLTDDRLSDNRDPVADSIMALRESSRRALLADPSGDGDSLGEDRVQSLPLAAESRPTPGAGKADNGGSEVGEESHDG